VKVKEHGLTHHILKGNTMIQKFTDAQGNVIEVDDTITLLGPHPPVTPTLKATTDSHMADALKNKPTLGVNGEPIFDASSDNDPVNAMLIRTGQRQPTPTRSMNDAERRAFVDRAAWAEGVRKGYSR
jgi:hypothetical protein